MRKMIEFNKDTRYSDMIQVRALRKKLQKR